MSMIKGISKKLSKESPSRYGYTDLAIRAGDGKEWPKKITF